MRRFILLAPLIVLLALAAGLGGLLVLANEAPIHAGSLLFPFQTFSEQLRGEFIFDAAEESLYWTEIANRRVSDLERLIGSELESEGLRALHAALDRAAIALAAAPEQEQADLKERFAIVLLEAGDILARLQVAHETEVVFFEQILGKVNTLQNMVGLAALEAARQAQTVAFQLPGPLPTPTPRWLDTGQTGNPGEIDPQIVLFPPGSEAARHAFFPLQGKHQQIACNACHSAGRYAGTPTLCVDCHRTDTPTAHYPGDCSACHTSLAWTDIHFNHIQASATECQACHEKNRPAGHYSGQCSACHTTSTWAGAIFNHTAASATDCQACHEKNRPAGHYSGQCAACHSTSRWSGAVFNHAAEGATDCQACHEKNRPAGHFAGQCSLCHTTSRWSGAVFNHSATGATDCQACHEKNRPAGHYAGQCSLCHSTTVWSDVSFNHQAAGAVDCQSCHRAPDGHWTGQCSNCHNTSGWGGINVLGHTFPMNHGNAGGVCSNCHTGTVVAVNCYRCHDQAEMEKKHAEEGIFDIASRCLVCHPTGTHADN